MRVRVRKWRLGYVYVSGCGLRGINIDIERYGAGTRTVIRNVVKREKMDSKRLKRRHKTRTVKSCP